MVMCFRAKGGTVAIWEKPPSGDPMAPFDNPYDHLEYIRFHSDLQYLANNLISTNISINHALVAGQIGTGYSTSAGSGSTGTSPAIADGRITASNLDLYTHSLGYIPLFFVLYNGMILSGGVPVQFGSSQLRTVSAFATTSKIIIRDIGISSELDLPAVTLQYDVYIFKDPAADPVLPVFQVKTGAPEKLILGQGKIQAGQSVVRKAEPGDSPVLNFPLTRTSDTRNGNFRFLRPDGTRGDTGRYAGVLNNMDYMPVSFT